MLGKVGLFLQSREDKSSFRRAAAATGAHHGG